MKLESTIQSVQRFSFLKQIICQFFGFDFIIHIVLFQWWCKLIHSIQTLQAIMLNTNYLPFVLIHFIGYQKNWCKDSRWKYILVWITYHDPPCLPLLCCLLFKITEKLLNSSVLYSQQDLAIIFHHKFIWKLRHYENAIQQTLDQNSW